MLHLLITILNKRQLNICLAKYLKNLISNDLYLRNEKIKLLFILEKRKKKRS